MVGMPSSLRILASVPAENIWGLTWHWYQWLVCCEKIGLKCFIHTFLWIFYSDLETIFPESRTESWIPGVILTHLSERLEPQKKKEIHLEAKRQEKVHCPPPYTIFAHAIAYNDYKPGSCSDLSSFGARTLWFLCLLPSASPVSLYPVIINSVNLTPTLCVFQSFYHHLHHCHHLGYHEHLLPLHQVGRWWEPDVKGENDAVRNHVCLQRNIWRFGLLADCEEARESPESPLGAS